MSPDSSGHSATDALVSYPGGLQVGSLFPGMFFFLPTHPQASVSIASSRGLVPQGLFLSLGTLVRLCTSLFVSVPDV